MRKNSRTKFLIGEEFINYNGRKFKILGYTENPRERIISFEGEQERIVKTDSLRTLKIRDYGAKTYYGKGIVGYKYNTKHFLFNRWANMLGRCYNEKHSGFKSYGAKGIYVSEYLLNFSNYVDFISSLDNYDLLIKNPNKWDIDKDEKSNGSDRCYSKDTLQIIKKEDNIEIENSKKRIQVIMLDEKLNILKNFSSISEAERETGIYKGNIARTVRLNKGVKKTYKAGRYIWREKDVK